MLHIEKVTKSNPEWYALPDEHWDRAAARLYKQGWMRYDRPGHPFPTVFCKDGLQVYLVRPLGKTKWVPAVVLYREENDR